MSKLPAGAVWLAYQGVQSFGFALAWTVAPVLFVRELHMSPLELVLVGTAMEVAYFLFEVPTGVVADTFSRRLSTILGVLGLGLSFLCTGVAPGVAVVLGAAAFMGFAWTFKSGADEAWIVDEVGAERAARSFQRGAQAARVGSLLGIGVAVALALVDLRLPIVAGGLALVALAVLLALVMPETGFRRARRDGIAGAVAMLDTAGRGARLVRARPLLMLIVAIAFFAGMASEGFDRLSEAHLIVDVGMPTLAGLDSVVWFGVLGGVATLISIVVAQPLVRRFERLDRPRMVRLLLGLEAAQVAALLAFALAVSFALAIAAFWAVKLARSLAAPVWSTWLNASIDDSSVRATVLSITNLGDSAGEWGGGPALGVVGNVFGIRSALAAAAGALVPALGLYARAFRHHEREPELEQLPATIG
jgi:DHA3 family tetracycline resistance protein-like MFS transporter